MRSITGVCGAILAALLIAGVFTLPASAITISTVAISLPGFTLDGAEHIANTSNSVWRADGEGNPAPWHVNVSSTDFDNGAGKTIDVSFFEIRLLDSSIEAVSGPPNPKPSSTQTTFTPLSATDLKIVSAVGAEAPIAWDLTPDFRLTVAPEAYAGNYSATVTISIVVSP